MRVELVLCEVPQIGTCQHYWIAHVYHADSGDRIHSSHDYDEEREALETTVAWCEQQRHHIAETIRRPIQDA